jgi:hypothetical protein
MGTTDNQRQTLSVDDNITGIPFYVKGDSSTGALYATTIGGTLVNEYFDYIGASYPDTVTETYTYKSGGAGGTTVATITVVYTTSTKDVLTSVTRS